MLYDPNWQKSKVQADVFSLESLIAWLEQQPAETEYHWSLAGSCLLGRWCEAKGLHGEELFTKSIELGQWDGKNNGLAEAALGNLTECTFGAALARARKAAQAS